MRPESEAVLLFADRARRVDSHFTLSSESEPAVARIVARLDGMPLAIELAAARAEALGVGQLLERLDDRFGLLIGGDRTAAARQRSLAATVEWSYQLLSEQERRVFRRLALFPGPFTLDAAQAVAGQAAGQVVLHLVDCSLLVPPQLGPDGRPRYLMLETLRVYGAERLAEAGEHAAAALAGYALQVAEQAAAGLETSAGELAAARWLDAEDATVHQGLTWGLEHDPATALRLAVVLAPWWQLRGRSAAGYELLHAAAGQAEEGDESWCAAQLWLGELAVGASDDHRPRALHRGQGCPGVAPAVADAGPGPERPGGLPGTPRPAARRSRGCPPGPGDVAADRRSGRPGAGPVLAGRPGVLRRRSSGQPGPAAAGPADRPGGHPGQDRAAVQLSA